MSFTPHRLTTTRAAPLTFVLGSRVLAVGTDQTVYSKSSAPGLAGKLNYLGGAPPIAWGGYDDIGGHRLLLEGVAKLGANELTAVGIDPAGRLMLSHYDGARWQSFQPVIGQAPNTLLSPPFYRPAVATYGH